MEPLLQILIFDNFFFIFFINTAPTLTGWNFFGLHKDWCANLTPLALVVTECMNIARAGWMVGWGVRPIQGPDHDNVGATTKGNPVITLGKSEPGTIALAGA
jgi:hypothetical protein